jgi:hypothetical protein
MTGLLTWTANVVILFICLLLVWAVPCLNLVERPSTMVSNDLLQAYRKMLLQYLQNNYKLLRASFINHNRRLLSKKMFYF